QGDFWQAIDALVASGEIVLDRPVCSSPVCYEDARYPYEHGYLASTRSGGGQGIDVWIGSRIDLVVAGVICAFDVRRRDADIKLLLGCTPADAAAMLAIHQEGNRPAMLVLRA